METPLARDGGRRAIHGTAVRRVMVHEYTHGGFPAGEGYVRLGGAQISPSFCCSTDGGVFDQAWADGRPEFAHQSSSELLTHANSWAMLTSPVKLVEGHMEIKAVSSGSVRLTDGLG